MPDLDIPALSYFEQGNAFAGSLRKDFRFRVVRADDTLSVAVWNADICFELAENKQEQSFALTDDGLRSAGDWILSLLPA
ncbi:MAG: hypothetical protein ACI4K9_04765 [Candidatus Fimenecus sp.]